MHHDFAGPRQPLSRFSAHVTFQLLICPSNTKSDLANNHRLVDRAGGWPMRVDTADTCHGTGGDFRAVADRHLALISLTLTTADSLCCETSKRLTNRATFMLRAYLAAKIARGCHKEDRPQLTGAISQSCINAVLV
jgi:hypothetical protein